MDRTEGKAGVVVTIERQDMDLDSAVQRLQQMDDSRPELLGLLPDTDPLRAMLERGMDSGER